MTSQERRAYAESFGNSWETMMDDSVCDDAYAVFVACRNELPEDYLDGSQWSPMPGGIRQFDTFAL